MRKIQCISFPRSGHHLLVDLLATYLGNELVYADRYGAYDIHGRPVDPAHPHRPGPPRGFAQEPLATLEKNHDFNLDTVPTCPVLVQIRAPVPAIVSWFCIERDEGRSDTRTEWEHFARTKADFYRRFKSRWIDTDAMILDYDTLVAAPLRALLDVLGYAYAVIDIERAAAVVSSFDIRPRNSIENFKWYDPDFCSRIESLANGT